MELFIEGLTGAVFELKVSPFETIKSVKTKIQQAEGIPISQQHLIWQNNELKDDFSLRDYSIQAGMTLKLVLGMRGGPINTRRVLLSSPSPVFSNCSSPSFRSACTSPQNNSSSNLSNNATSNTHITLLVFKEGDQINFYRVVDKNDPSLSPVIEALPDEPCNGTAAATTSTTTTELLSSEDDATGESPTKSSAHKAGETLLIQSKPFPEYLSRFQNEDDVRKTRLRRQLEAALENGDYEDDSSASSCCSENELGKDDEDEDDENYVEDDEEQEEQEAEGLNTKSNQSKLLKEFLMPRNDEAEEEDLDDEETTDHLSDWLSNWIGCQPPRVVGAAANSKSGARSTSTSSSSVAAAMAAFQLGRHFYRNQSNATALHRHRLISGSTNTSNSLTNKLSREEVMISNASELHEQAKLKEKFFDLQQKMKQAKLSRNQRQNNQQLKQHQPSVPIKSDSSIRPGSRQINRGRLSPIQPIKPKIDSVERKSSNSKQYPPLFPHLKVPLGPPSSSVSSIAGSPNILPQIKSHYNGRSSSLGPSGSNNITSTTTHLINPMLSGSTNNLNASITPSATAVDPIRSTEKLRCSLCNKRTGLATSYECRCGRNFCSRHRYAETHQCTYDYKSQGRQWLQENNPIISASKLPKI